MPSTVSQGLATIVNPIDTPLRSVEEKSHTEKVNQSTPQTRRGRVGATGFLSREQIIEAVQYCFDEGGYDGVTIRAIARRLTCAVGSIYRYFPDKRQLLLACAEHRMKPVLDGLQSKHASLESSVEQYLEVAFSHRQLYLLWFWLEESLPSQIAAIIERWGNIIESRSIADQYWSQVHGMIVMKRSSWQILNTIDIPQPLSLIDSDVDEDEGYREIEIVIPDGSTQQAAELIAARSLNAALKQPSAPKPQKENVPAEPEISVMADIDDVTLL